MKIHGFQKMTLLDFPGRIACTVFTAGCNMRCPFCHNAFLVTELDDNAEFDQEEIISYLKRRKGVLDGVAITGGEPLLFDGTKDFIKRIKTETGLAVKLDTNGTFPEKLKNLIDEELVDYVAMDVKNSLERYGETVGISNFNTENIEKSISVLLENRVDYEFRTTVVKEFHNVCDMENIGEMIKGAKRYFLQKFTDSGHLIGSGMTAPSDEFMKTLQNTAAKYIEKVELRGV